MNKKIILLALLISFSSIHADGNNTRKINVKGLAIAVAALVIFDTANRRYERKQTSKMITEAVAKGITDTGIALKEGELA